MISKKLKAVLDEHQIKFVSLAHSQAYTAQEVAQTIHAKGRTLAKTVIVKRGRESLMAVLPASLRIDFKRLSAVTHEQDVRLATESEFLDLFPDCEPGAMPPFGNLYGMHVLCDTSLAGSEDIYFNAGTHNEVIRMSFRDFVRLVRPEICSFSEKP